MIFERGEQFLRQDTEQMQMIYNCFFLTLEMYRYEFRAKIKLGNLWIVVSEYLEIGVYEL